MKKAIHSCITK